TEAVDCCNTVTSPFSTEAVDWPLSTEAVDCPFNTEAVDWPSSEVFLLPLPLPPPVENFVSPFSTEAVDWPFNTDAVDWPLSTDAVDCPFNTEAVDWPSKVMTALMVGSPARGSVLTWVSNCWSLRPELEVMR